MNIRNTKIGANLGALVVAFAATSAFVVGTTMALFSATETSSANSFTSGTVSVGLGATSTTCSITDLAPGDSSTNFGSGSATLQACNYKVKYTGSLPAYLAVDISVTAGSTPLYTATSDGLQMLVGVNSGPTIISGTTYKNQLGNNVSIASGVVAKNILLATNPASTNDLLQFDVDYLLPLVASNTLQGGSATLTITFHAVQSANQTLGTCLAGRACSDIIWS